MYKLFGSVNEVDSHNKSRQSDLVLDKFWVTQCGWLRSCTTVYIEITITNGCKLFHYGVKIYNYEKSIGIRELYERLTLDCFNNPFSTDTRIPENNIPPLDKVGEGETFST